MSRAEGLASWPVGCTCHLELSRVDPVRSPAGDAARFEHLQLPRRRGLRWRGAHRRCGRQPGELAGHPSGRGAVCGKRPDGEPQARLQLLSSRVRTASASRARDGTAPASVHLALLRHLALRSRHVPPQPSKPTPPYRPIPAQSHAPHLLRYPRGRLPGLPAPPRQGGDLRNRPHGRRPRGVCLRAG